MKAIFGALAAAAIALSVQPGWGQLATTAPISSSDPSPSLRALPEQAVGAGDLLSIAVADCPELTRSFRVSEDGSL